MHYSNILGLLTVLKSVNGNKGLYENGAYISLIFQCSPNSTTFRPGYRTEVAGRSDLLCCGLLLNNQVNLTIKHMKKSN